MIPLEQSIVVDRYNDAWVKLKSDDGRNFLLPLSACAIIQDENGDAHFVCGKITWSIPKQAYDQVISFLFK